PSTRCIPEPTHTPQEQDRLAIRKKDTPAPPAWCSPPMPARSIIPHLKTLLMCGVAYVTKERIDARALAWIPLGSSSPQASACPTHVHTTTVTTVAREFQRSSKSGGEIPPADFSLLVYSCVLLFVKNVSENMPE
ncbi:hypothetical protein XENOCAPTIV_025519, partial [Xenoophorus captivus]